MTLTTRALASTPTAHLARWRGGPAKDRVRHLKTAFHYDAGDPWRGQKIGKAYGCLYHVTRKGLIPVQYFGHRMSEVVAGDLVYSWEDLRRRGYFG